MDKKTDKTIDEKTTCSNEKVVPTNTAPRSRAEELRNKNAARKSKALAADENTSCDESEYPAYKSKKSVRLNKAVALTGLASRRKSEELILAGEVKVNGKVVKDLSVQIVPNKDTLTVKGKALPLTTRYTYLLLNKPRGYVSTCKDQEGRKTVMELVGSTKIRLFPVGRLDIQSEGAILITNDGNFANAVLNPTLAIPKKYRVKVSGLISDDDIEHMRTGVVIDKKYKTKPARVFFLSATGKNSWIEVTIFEGKNRQIRKMCENVGHSVLKIKRTAIGPFRLGALGSGKMRLLTYEEISQFKF